MPRAWAQTTEYFYVANSHVSLEPYTEFNLIVL